MLTIFRSVDDYQYGLVPIKLPVPPQVKSIAKRSQSHVPFIKRNAEF